MNTAHTILHDIRRAASKAASLAAKILTDATLDPETREDHLRGIRDDAEQLESSMVQLYTALAAEGAE